MYHALSKTLFITMEVAPARLIAIQQIPMPDADHSPAFWTSVARTFGRDTRIVFDLFDEPFPDNQGDSDAAWRCWRSSPRADPAPGPRYPTHTGIVATTFWVGEVFDPHAADGSQVTSTYDAHWMTRYGGCDGVIAAGVCTTERRTAVNGFFPTRMTPRRNPFYLDLPFDDVNNATAFGMRTRVIPWAHDPGYGGHADDPSFSYMKNRWVAMMHDGHTCYGQIEDAGPGQYADARYVFGRGDRRPANTRYNGAGLDVSPALNGCLGFADLNGDGDRVSWRFVDRAAIPAGPWTKVITTSAVDNS